MAANPTAPMVPMVLRWLCSVSTELPIDFNEVPTDASAPFALFSASTTIFSVVSLPPILCSFRGEFLLLMIALHLLHDEGDDVVRGVHVLVVGPPELLHDGDHLHGSIHPPPAVV